MGEIQDQERKGRRRVVERALLDVANKKATPRGTVRDLVKLLKTPGFDWRDLARALDRVGQEAAHSPTVGADTVATAANVALVAMRRAMGADSSLSDANARFRVQKACDPSTPPEVMLASVFGELKRIIDFDIATFVEYQRARGDEKILVRGRFAADGGVPFKWPARWIEIKSASVERLKGADRRVDLVQHYATEAGARALDDNPVAQAYLTRGARYVVSIARVDSGQLCGSVSLARRDNKPPFAFAEQDRLDSLGLDRVMRLASEAYATRRKDLTLRIAKLFDFASNSDTKEIAREVVELIGRGFDWEYVAIFRVARVRQQFEVIAQYDATGGGLSPRGDSTQPLDGRESGMLGNARRARKALRVPDVRPPEPRPSDWRPPHDYIRTSEAAASAMCVPICLGDDVEWVLDCESTQVNGFLKPDEDAILELIRDIERTLRLWFESRLNKALLDWVDQGVIVVDENQRIERLNDAASILLGSTMRFGSKLADFAADEETRRLLNEPSDLPGEGIRLALRAADGSARPVQASVRAPEDTFGRRIWLFSELAEERWGVALQEMRQTIQDVAAQARGPLVLAGALLRQAQRSLANGDAQKLADGILDRAARSLAKTDITYERLASSWDAISEPHREGRLAAFSIPLTLQALVDELPKEDRRSLVLEAPTNLPAIRADSERMAFALRSIVGYLLGIRAPDARLEVRAWLEGDRVSVSVALRSQFTAANGEAPQQASLSDAAVAARQALTGARSVVEGHGGKLSVYANEDGLEALAEALPVSGSIAEVKS